METKAPKEKAKDKTPAPEKKAEIARHEPTASERFTGMVVKEFAANAGGTTKVTDFQRKLAQNYFIAIDKVLKDNEQKRLAKDEKYRDPLPFTWNNVNMPQIAIDVMRYSLIGLDPMQNNHLAFVAFKNKATNKYDIGFIQGYKGLELKARKYGIELPTDIVFEVVYSTDKFKELKKNHERKVEGYEFDIVNSFNRGEIIGGFYYKVFADPSKNKLVVFDMGDIEKRKPKYASAEFWGGEKDKWENGKKAGKEIIEGWQHEMVEKTLKRAAWNEVTIDSEKIDTNFLAIVQRENDVHGLKVQAEIDQNANKENLTMDITPHEEIEQPEQNQEPEAAEVDNPKWGADEQAETGTLNLK